MISEEWDRSTFCASGECVEVRRWNKSSSCSGNSCVEVSREEDTICVRQSELGDMIVLGFTVDEWEAFIKGVKAGEFDL